jgi:negative regulator of flagellin synthesis FlgM
MKIGPSNPDGARVDPRLVVGERTQVARTGSGTDPVAEPAAIDKVSLSSQRQAAVGASPGIPFDDKKVEEVRRAIAEGRFPVDAKKVADQLIADARELLGLNPAVR